MTIDLAAAISLFGAFLSVTAAYQIHKTQVRIALYERRIKLYDTIFDFVAAVRGAGKPPSLGELLTLSLETRDAEFLFPKSTKELIQTLMRDSSNYKTEYMKWEHCAEGTSEHEAALEKLSAYRRKFDGCFDVMRKEFGQHLNLAWDWCPWK